MGCETFFYACKIEETTNGGWCSACGQARETVEVISAWRIEKHVEIDEPKRTPEIGRDQAQKIADPKAQEKIDRVALLEAMEKVVPA